MIRWLLWRFEIPIWRIWWLLRAKHLVGVFVAVIDDTDNILIIRKKRGVALGWQLPGGGKDHTLSPHQGAAEELFEETGIRAFSLHQLPTIYNARHWDMKIPFLCMIYSGPIQVRDTFEIAEAKFISIKHMDEYLSGDCLEIARSAVYLHKKKCNLPRIVNHSRFTS